MAVYDAERGCLVVRVVFDGPAYAGKTTNLAQLTNLFPVQRRSELYTPGAIRGRTMFFDWLEIEAGRVGGQPFRCQLLTVPGQAARSYRRRPLLESADAVVFVCDSVPRNLGAARVSYAQLCAQLEKRRPLAVPVLVQANKQDLPEALAPEEVARELGYASDEFAPFAARAAEGVGVRETVTAALRAAVREVQRRAARTGWAAITGAPQTADELFDAMLALEDDAELPDPAASPQN